MSGDDIVSRADSLMRRRRSFVATEPPVAASGPTPEQPPPPQLLDFSEDDIPVLTEEILPEAPAGASPDRFDETLAARLASEFAHSLEQRLAGELPSLVEASLAVLEADLRRGILDIARDAIKDFVARRQQLQLPLEAPDGDNSRPERP